MTKQKQKEKKEIKIAYQVPVSSRITRRKKTILEDIINRFPKMVQWLLTIYYKEDMSFSEKSITHSRKLVKELAYPTKSHGTPYNCKRAVYGHHSHFYDTAITESIQKWSSFSTWKEKRKKAGKETGKQFPDIESYAPLFDSTMFSLDLENEWVILHTERGKENIYIPITVPNKKRYKNLEQEKIKSLRLKRNKNDELVFIFNQTVMCSSFSPSSSSSPEGDNPSPLALVGMDLGERFLASSVTITPRNQLSKIEIQRVRFHDSSELRETNRKEMEIRKNLQNKGLGSEIPKMSWSYQNKKQERVREIVDEETKWIQKLIENNREVYVFVGDLSTPTPPNRGSLSRRLNSFPYRELKNQLKHRLKREGAHVHLVNEYNTSKTCPSCGSTDTDRVNQARFKCLSCGYRANADYVGAWNIVGRGISQLSIPELEGAVP
ncbi:hypothetical protein C9439_05645 [archaeon SCG-AAA382B04]|nr:hypothetical protein C9439_05645 [archaeon SCG-AAA382B04]